MERLASELPEGFGFEWMGQSLEEINSGKQARDGPGCQKRHHKPGQIEQRDAKHKGVPIEGSLSWQGVSLLEPFERKAGCPDKCAACKPLPIRGERCFFLTRPLFF
jgi:hypothetical protein